MVEIIWIERAINDLDQISEYISKTSPKYADITVDKIFRRTKILKRYAETGRTVPEFGRKSIRELIEGNYRIIYEVKSSTIIEILTVHHSSKKL